MSERNNDYCNTGWYPTLQNASNAATRPQMIALRDLCLLGGMKNSAAAIDNAIDILERETAQKLAEEFAAHKETEESALDRGLQ